MIVVAYLVAIILFWIVQMFATGVALFTMTFIYSILGVERGNERILTQFLGTQVGVVAGMYVSLYSFKWFDREPNIWLLIVVCGFVWFLFNSQIQPEHRPTAQRIGVVFGFLAAPGIFIQLF